MRKFVLFIAVFVLGVFAGGGCLYFLIGSGSAMVYSGAAEKMADAAIKVKLGEQERFILEFEKNALIDVAAVRSFGDYDFVRSALRKYEVYYKISGTSMPREVADAIESLPAAQDVPRNLGKSPKYSSGRIGVGETVPITSLMSIDGQAIPLNNGIVVVNFFATWCQPCLMELPNLERNVWDEFKDQGVTVVGIGRGHSPSELRAFKETKTLSFPFVADPTEEIYNKFAKEYIPQTFLIGKDGSIKHHMVGYDLEDFSELLNAVNRELTE